MPESPGEVAHRANGNSPRSITLRIGASETDRESFPMAVPTIAPAPLSPADILTPQELAARLKVRTGWVYEQMRPRRTNPLPTIKLNRFLRFHWPTVCAWLLSAQEPSTGKSRRKNRKAVAR